jgi:hypothetical protein
MYIVGRSSGTSPKLLCQCTCQGHSRFTVNTCSFAKLMLATAQVSADSNAKRSEGRENAQNGMHHECRTLAKRVCMSTDVSCAARHWNGLVAAA